MPIVRARFANEWFDHWGSTSLTTFLRFPDRVAATAFEAELSRFAERHVFPDGNIKKGQSIGFVNRWSMFPRGNIA